MLPSLNFHQNRWYRLVKNTHGHKITKSKLTWELCTRGWLTRGCLLTSTESAPESPTATLKKHTISAVNSPSFSILSIKANKDKKY